MKCRKAFKSVKMIMLIQYDRAHFVYYSDNIILERLILRLISLKMILISSRKIDIFYRFALDIKPNYLRIT